MFGDLKYPGEEGYNAETDTPLVDDLNEENMKAVV
jgi:hypothetical protein